MRKFLILLFLSVGLSQTTFTDEEMINLENDFIYLENKVDSLSYQDSLKTIEIGLLEEELKLTNEQLTQLQNLVSNTNKIKFDLGTLEAQKHSMLHGLDVANEAIIKMQKDFEKDYGTYDINIQDGTINYKDEQTDKKD